MASRRSKKAAKTVIVKTTGEREPFDEQKLRRSLRRAGARRGDIERIVGVVRANLVDGMTTRRLYQIAYRELRRKITPVATAARYSLQRAILELGPSGYPFEKFIGELIRHEGYRVQVGVTLRGKFVRHEIDVVATRRRRRRLVECKFRGQANAKVDVRTALYVYARAQDLAAVRAWHEFWLVTNGRFTSDARRYGEGVGLYMLSWEHPAGDSLRERIDRSGLHPITSLSALRKREKQELLRDGHVLARDLHDDPGLVDRLRLSERRRQQLVAEVQALCAPV